MSQHFCTSCGSPVDVDLQQFCTNCGAPVAAAQDDTRGFTQAIPRASQPDAAWQGQPATQAPPSAWASGAGAGQTPASGVASNPNMVIIAAAVAAAVIILAALLAVFQPWAGGGSSTDAAATQEVSASQAAVQEDDADDDDGYADDEAYNDDAIYDELMSAYEKMSDQDKAISHTAEVLNNNIFSGSKSKRQGYYNDAQDVCSEVEGQLEDLSYLNVPSSSKHYSEWNTLMELQEDLYHRIDVMCEAWEVSVKYDDPKGHESAILEPLARDNDSSGKNVYKKDFEKRYPNAAPKK